MKIIRVLQALEMCLAAWTFSISAVQAAQAQAPAAAETSREVRFQLDLHVPDAALRALLPPGFTSSVAMQGPAKDANLRIVFTDRLTVRGPEGKRVGTGTSQLVELVAPVKDKDGLDAQLVIGGLTGDAASVPGVFADYQLAATHTMSRTVTNENGPLVESQDWVFRAASGEEVEMHIRFERGFGFRIGPGPVKFYSAQKAGFSQTSQQEEQLDILRNVTTNPADRVKAFSLKAGGGSFAKLFDGSEKVLSWDDILWLERAIVPAP